MTATPEALPVELKPCPFCGSEQCTTAPGAFSRWFSICKACGATANSDEGEDAAIAAWNTRNASEQPSAPEASEPFGYWVEQKHADPILLRKPAYIPEPSELRTVTPLYASPQPSAVQVEAVAITDDIPAYGADDISHLEGLADYLDGYARDKAKERLFATRDLFNTIAKRLRQFDELRRRIATLTEPSHDS